MDKAFRFVKGHFLPIIAWLLAITSVIFVPVDNLYLSYFDLRTLLCLFSTMLVIGAFKNIRIFIITASALVHKLKNTRALVVALVFITYFFSIFIANDMALLTFLPLTITVFRSIGKEKYIATTVILQNIAANLGGMIMPFGNPQSLYLYSFYHISISEFLSIMWVPFAVAFAIILVACLLVKKEDAVLLENTAPPLNKNRAALYAAFAVIALLSVLRVGNYYIITAIVAVGIAVADYKAYNKVDYNLLLTFTAFFIFANNMARIDAVRSFVTSLTDKNTLLTGILSCQLISNVPTAIFLSKFTENYRALLLAVNVGGTGTLVASLASLISLKAYCDMYPEQTKTYILKFSAFNFGVLAVLTAVCCLLV